MLTRLLLLFCLTGHTFAEEPPDVDCVVVHLEYVQCVWNKQGTPKVNYTFTSGFHNDKNHTCTVYLLENNTHIGCNRPYVSRADRFSTFHTILVHGNMQYPKDFELKTKVKLNPPTNLTVENESNYNLWFYWNQTFTYCVQTEILYRTNDNDWEPSKVSEGKQSYCINLISSTSRYELKARSKISNNCGGSDFWSNWSKPVVWGSNNGTDSTKVNNSMFLWTPVLYVLAPITLILLVMMLLHNERLRIRIIPVVPKPLISHDIQDWLQLSKGLKESSKANFNERACPVREYRHVSESDSESCDSYGSSTFSVTTDQTDCSISIPVSAHCSSATCTGRALSEGEEQVSV